MEGFAQGESTQAPKASVNAGLGTPKLVRHLSQRFARRPISAADFCIFL